MKRRDERRRTKRTDFLKSRKGNSGTESFALWSRQVPKPLRHYHSDELVIPTVAVNPFSMTDIREKMELLEIELNDIEREHQNEIEASEAASDIIYTISVGISRTLENTLRTQNFDIETESENESITDSKHAASESRQHQDKHINKSAVPQENYKEIVQSAHFSLKPVIYSVVDHLKSEIMTGAYREAYSRTNPDYQSRSLSSNSESNLNQQEESAESPTKTSHGVVENPSGLRRSLRRERSRSILALLEAARKESYGQV